MKTAIVSLLLAAATATVYAQNIADSVAGYSGTQGLNGWWYGYYDVSGDTVPGYDPTNDFAQCTIWDGSIWWAGDSVWTSLVASSGHPNGSVNNPGRPTREQWAVRRWVSTVTGAFQVYGHIAKENTACGDGTTAMVFLNGTNLLTRSLAAGDGTGSDYSLEVQLQANDMLDFAISAGCCGDAGCDGTTFTAVVDRPLQWTVNGHYYELVRANISWPAALAAASSRSYAGLPGHLAVLTSAPENDFISLNLGTGNPAEFAWLGGRAPNDDGVWRWVSGPESGTQFSFWATATAPYNYVNWGGVEPNHSKPDENYLMLNIGQVYNGLTVGQWADAAPNPSLSDPVIGYLVEYEVPIAQLFIRMAPDAAVVYWSTNASGFSLQTAADPSPTAAWFAINGPYASESGFYEFRLPLVNLLHKQYFRLRYNRPP